MSASTCAWRLSPIVTVAACALAIQPARASDDGPQTGEETATDAAVAHPVEAGDELVNSNTLFVTGALFSDSASSVGVEVAPMGAALRAQLGLRDDRGVVVTKVEAEGPGAQAGIQLHDVLLSAGGEPVNSVAALQEQIDAAGEEAIPVILMRGGKRMSVEVTPSNVSGVELDSGRHYWIGSSAAAVDEALRAQLALPEGQGLVVTEVYDDTAAAEAGIEMHDVLLEFGGTPLSSVEDLISSIQKAGGEPTPVKLLRGGDELTLKVTPRVREGGDGTLWLYDPSRSMTRAGLASLYSAGVNVDSIPTLSMFHRQTVPYVAANDGTYRFWTPAVGEVGEWFHNNVATQPDAPTADSIEQQLHALIEEARTLTERMRALQELIRHSSDGAEAADPQPDSGEKDESTGETD